MNTNEIPTPRGAYRTETMNIDEIPTPETDAVEKAFTVDSKQNPQHRLALKSRDLERRLTVARETLIMIADESSNLAHAERMADRALKQTAPKQ